MDSAELHNPRAKELGAYYTDAQVADFLTAWAVRDRADLVIDPSFGGGVFLRSACKRLLALGGSPAAQVFGVELDEIVHRRITDKLVDEFAVRRPHLISSDFFAVDGNLSTFDAVVGNPPFIRYQRFSGAARERAHARCLAAGVELTELASSWAPFVVHSTSILRPGGRLAMVVPMEIAHAAYARPVLAHLCRSFESICLLTFRKRLFPDLSQDTALLLADNRGNFAGRLYWRDIEHAGKLTELATPSFGGRRRLDAEALCSGKARLVDEFLPRRLRSLYDELKRRSGVVRLGDVADVGIGYVTGANDFFHVDDAAVAKWRIPARFLRPAVRRGRELAGLRFTPSDWEQSARGYLLQIERRDEVPSLLREYLEDGRRRGVADGFKCRNRTPWYSVPHVHRPDAFITYMSGMSPRFVVNEANAVAPNSLHVVRMHPLSAQSAHAVAVGWQTSLTRLSVEIEGHAMGGGMLKIEPTEAERIVIALPKENGVVPRDVAAALDRFARAGDVAQCRGTADRLVLREQLGLSRKDCDLLAEAAEELARRRYGRGVQS